MKQDCRNDCVDPFALKPIHNRPGLPHIAYRIGTYSDFLEAILRDLNKNDVLQAWTHRAPDDPGIALLEGASILGDILTFYQEVYANEAYLRTAQWRESVADLVRLLGYRLSPSVGGQATFAFEIKGHKSVVIPAGFPIKAQVESPAAAEFESIQESIAYPWLSQFHLYRPRHAAQPIMAGLNRLEIQAVNGSSDGASIQALDLQAGDRIMLVPDIPIVNLSDTLQKKAQILIVSEVQQVLERTIITFEGALTENRGTTVRAYRIGRTFRHFGHNAPAQLTKFVNSSVGVTQKQTNFQRNIYSTHTPASADANFYSKLLATEMPLAEEVDDLAVGGKLICQSWTKLSEPLTAVPSVKATQTLGAVPREVMREAVPLARATQTLGAVPREVMHEALPSARGTQTLGAVPREVMREAKKPVKMHLTVVKEIKEVRADSLVWGNLSGPSTVVTLNDTLITKRGTNLAKSDIRHLTFHEVTSPPITLRAPTKWNEGAFGAQMLNYFGTHEEALALVGRTLLLARQDGTLKRVTVTSRKADFSLTGKDKQQKWLWSVALDQKLEPFVPEDFDERSPTVTVYGNLVEATQGKSQKEAVLGNGDSRQAFQTFKIPKAPLSYHNSVGESPPEVPALQLYVNNRLWKRVPSFFNRGADEEIYVVREDANGNSWVQFGDGKTGRRLPSGIKNVVVKYRTGIGAYGALKEGSTVQAGGKLDRLDKIRLPGVVTGGEEAESGQKAKEAAPGKIQSLGRLVSRQDFESETLAIPGVSKVLAAWGLVDNVPTVVLSVLMQRGREKEIDTVRQILAGYNRCRGPQRFPIQVNQGQLEYLYLVANVALDPTFRAELVKKAIKEALGLTGEEGNEIDGSEGLFALVNRRFGQNEYATRIEGVIQNVDGVRWSQVTALGSLSKAKDPSTLTTPAVPARQAVISCDKRHVLTLYAGHLKLNVVSAPAMEAC